MSRLLRLSFTVCAAVAVLLFVPSAALAAGNDVGHNLGSLLRHYASEVYGGILAVVALVFLLNRRFTDLAVFFVAAILVGWLVFSPEQVADAARAIGQRVLP
jgi:Sec-independent protein translocase protein TatA